MRRKTIDAPWPSRLERLEMLLTSIVEAINEGIDVTDMYTRVNNMIKMEMNK